MLSRRIVLWVAIGFVIGDAALVASAPPKSPRLDNFGDPLPAAAIARLGTLRLRHGDQISTMALSPDGKTLVSAEYGQHVHVWDTASGKERARIYANLGWAYQVKFSPDGKMFAASATCNYLQIWDCASCKPVQTLKHDCGHTRAFAFSPDSQSLVSCGDDFQPALWNVRDGKIVRRFKGPTAAIFSLAFSPDGKAIAAGGLSGVIYIWHTATGNVVATLASGGRVELVAFAPDGKTLAAIEDDGFVRLWDVRKGVELRRFRVPVHRCDVLAFSANSETLAAGKVDEAGVLRLWDTATGKECRHLTGQFHARVSAIRGDGKVHVTGYAGRALRLHDSATGKDLCPLTAHQGQIRSAEFSRDGRSVATAAYDGTVRLWDAATGQELRRFTIPPPKLTDGWSPPPMFSSLAFAPDGNRIVAASNFGQIRVWDDKLSKLHFETPRGGDWNFGVSFSPDSKVLGFGRHDKGVHLVDSATGKEIRTLLGHASSVDIVLFAPDNKTLVSCGRDCAVRIWDWTTGKQLGVIWPDVQRLPAIALSPDGETIATCGGEDRAVQLWDVKSRTAIARLDVNAGVLESLAFSPDGRMLAIGDQEGGIRLWEVGSRMLRRRFDGHRGAIQSLAFSRDGRKLVSGSIDASAIVWDVLHVENRPAKLAKKDLEGLWTDLAADGARAFRAVAVLQAFPKESVSMLRAHLRPVAPADDKRVKRLLADLDSDQFKTRQAAMSELDKLGEGALPQLHAALKKPLSLEMRTRVMALLGRLHELKGSRLPQARALEVLEYSNNPEARAVLQRLAEGVAEARLTRDAKAALMRLQAQN